MDTRLAALVCLSVCFLFKVVAANLAHALPDSRIILIPCKVFEIGDADYAVIKQSSVVEVSRIMVSTTECINLLISHNLDGKVLDVQVSLRVDSKKMGGKKIKVAPGKGKTVAFDLPYEMNCEHLIEAMIDYYKPRGFPEWGGEIIVKNAEKVFDFNRLHRIYKIDFSSKADGDFSKWSGVEAIRLNRREDIFPVGARDRWGGGFDLSGDIFLGWDESSIHIAALVLDDKHVNIRFGSDIWDGDSLQYALVFREFEVAPLLLGLALTADGVEYYQWMGKDVGLFEAGEFQVVRDKENKTTFYEIMIPWESFGLIPKQGVIFDFNAVIFDDDDGSGYDYWMQISPGIAGGWDPEKFKSFVIWE